MLAGAGPLTLLAGAGAVEDRRMPPIEFLVVVVLLLLVVRADASVLGAVLGAECATPFAETSLFMLWTTVPLATADFFPCISATGASFFDILAGKDLREEPFAVVDAAGFFGGGILADGTGGFAAAARSRFIMSSPLLSIFCSLLD